MVEQKYQNEGESITDAVRRENKRLSLRIEQIEDDRRFDAAVAAMQGLLAVGFETLEAVVDDAVLFADALLAELDEERSDD